MWIGEMIDRLAEETRRAGGMRFIDLPERSPTLPADADPQWRPAPNPADGSLLQDPEFTLPTCAGPLAFRLFYDSRSAATDSEWGYGRRASWPLVLRSDGTTVTVTHDDGTLRQYQKVGANFAVQGGNNGDTLVQNGDGTWDETRGDTGYQFHFPAGGYASLAYRANPQGMRLTCSYDASQRLQTVVEPAGGRLTLTYNSDSKVQTLEDWGNCGLIVLTYVGNNLTEEWEPEGRVTRYCQDSNHRLTGIYDPIAYCTSYSYDYAGRVLTRSVAGNLGRYTYVVDGLGVLNTVYTDPLGKVWTHLTSGGDPAGMIDPMGNRETYLYSNHQPQAFVNGLGCCATYLYDSNGYPSGWIDALGNRWTLSNDSYGNRLTEQNPLGYVTTSSFGASPQLRQVEAVIDPLGNRTTFGYYANGLQQYRQDALGNRTTYTWASQGVMATEVDPLGCCRTYQSDLAGNRTVEIDPLGACWTHRYDQIWRRVSTENPLGCRNTTQYDVRGMRQAEIDALGNRTSFSWNAAGSQTVRVNGLGYCWTVVYDACNRELASIDPLGRATSQVCDLADRRVAMIQPSGVRYSLGYDAANQCISRLEPAGLRHTTSYDAAGRAIATQDPLALRTSTVYDAMGRAVAEIRPTGACSTTVYDATGMAIAEVNPLGYCTTTVYNAISLPIAHIDPVGNRSTTLYDQRGMPQAQVAADGATTTTLYDAAKRQIATLDPAGFRTTTVHDAAGQWLALIDALGCRTTNIYAPTGQVIATMDPSGSRWSTIYDAAAQEVAAVDPFGARSTTLYDPSGAQVAQVDALSCRSTTIYDAYGRGQAFQEARGYRQTTIYDNYGRPVAALNARGYLTTTLYDSFGRAAATQDPLGYQTTTVFDSFGREVGRIDPLGYRVTATLGLLDEIVAQTDALGYTTTVLSDPVGRPMVTIDALGRRTTTVYEASGRASAEIDPLGFRTSFLYDPRGNRIATLDPRGYRTTVQFDPRGQESAFQDALGRWVTLTLDARGLTQQKTDAKGQIETRTYDTAGRHLLSAYADGTRMTLTYDVAGRPVQMADRLGLWTRNYDAVSQLVSENGPGYPNGHPLTSIYDEVGNRTGLVAWRGRQTYAYDPRDLNTALIDIEDGRTTWAYDSRHSPVRQDNPNGTRTTATYDATVRVLQIWHAKADGTPIDRGFYQYDPVGNPQYKQTADGFFTCSYDNLNQLVSENHPSLGLTTWSYDSARNRATEVSPTTITTSSYNGANELLSAVANGLTTTYLHDANGCRTREQSPTGVTSYAWDPSHRLLSVVQPSGAVLTNSYRGDGLRQKKVDATGTQQMVYDGHEVLASIDGAGALGQFYSRGRTLVKAHLPSKERYYHEDALGTVQALTDQAAAIETRYLLDAWGQVVSGSAGDNPFRFVGGLGYWYEAVQQQTLYYVRHRWLQPSTATWLSPDPVHGESRYRYVSNEPTVAIDPNGTYVVLVRGGPGIDLTMTALGNYIKATWHEAVLQPTYEWTVVNTPRSGSLPIPIPPNAEVVLQVLQQIYFWLAKPEFSNDRHGLWLYGHSWGGHIVGQIAWPSDDRINVLKQKIQDECHISFKRYVVSVGDAKDYPRHFATVRANLYCLAGDDMLQQKGWPRDDIWWWNPSHYNTRNLAGKASWQSGGKDYIIQPVSTPRRPNLPFYGYFRHRSFDGQSELSGRPSEQPTMHKFITQHLMAEHP